MTTPQLEQLRFHLQQLKLHKIEERLEALLQDASQQPLSYSDWLDRLLSEEVAAKTEKALQLRTHLARLPYLKTLEAFDFKYQPSLDQTQSRERATCRFLEQGENVVLLGPPGVGKTQVSIALRG